MTGVDVIGWRGPTYEGEFPTLGHEVIEWMTSYLATPDVGEFRPFVPTDDQARFLLRWYAVDDETGRRFRFRRAVYSRLRGGGKSPLVAAICAAEGLAPCVLPDGYDARGEPAGKPWSSERTPLVQIAAVSESQTKNAWTPLLEMLTGGPAVDIPGLEPMMTFVNLPGRGRIEPITAAALSHIGNPVVFAACDQTESWTPSNGGVRLHETLITNCGKRGGRTVETPNAFIPGEDSVAEQSAMYYAAVVEGRARDKGLLYDHREGTPINDLADLDALRASILVAQGDCALERGGWQDSNRLVAEAQDPAMSPQATRRWYLNQITHASDAWISAPEWNGCAVPRIELTRGTTITIGFDGSRHREDSPADATALVGCRVSDGYLFVIGLWEPPPGDTKWWVPDDDVDRYIAETFEFFDVVGAYCDPAHWRDQIAKWEQRYAGTLKVAASGGPHPMCWPTNASTRTSTMLEEFEAAVRARRISHGGGPALTRHILNARRRPKAHGMTIAKEHPRSDRKIDAAMAAALAYEARRDAISKGVDRKPASFIPYRIR